LSLHGFRMSVTLIRRSLLADLVVGSLAIT
jgi:hypothetical protein